MSREQYIIDRNLRFRRSTRTIWNVVKSIVKYAVATVSLAVVYYIVFALVVNTDSERQLKRENRLYERLTTRCSSVSVSSPTPSTDWS